MYYSYLKKINNSNVHNMMKENGGEKWIIFIIIIMILNRVIMRIIKIKTLMIKIIRNLKNWSYDNREKDKSVMRISK